jgi:putative transcriptional regulator
MATITSKRFPDGKFYQRIDDGPWKLAPDEPLFGPNFPDGEPAYDPDNLPWTPAQLANRKRIPRVRTLRRQLSLTQEEFSEQFHIPVGTLRDWEQGRSEPDAPAKALLKLIAADPEGAAEVLKPKLRPAAE